MALRPGEINTSHWDSTLEQREDGTFAVRLVSARNGPKRLQRRRDGCFSSIEQLRRMKGGERVKIAGAGLIRQRPGKDTAIFITLEDESGIANIVLWASQIDRFRRAVMASQLMQVEGEVQRSREGVIHVMASGIADRSEVLELLSETHQAEIQLSRAARIRNIRGVSGKVRRPLPACCRPRAIFADRPKR